MVEGPGCTLNGEKIRSKVKKGQKVSDVRGTLVKPVVVCFSFLLRSNTGVRNLLCYIYYLTTLFFQESDFNGNAFLSFCGLQYTGVETLGKELFLYFGSRALR